MNGPRHDTTRCAPPRPPRIQHAPAPQRRHRLPARPTPASPSAQPRDRSQRSLGPTRRIRQAPTRSAVRRSPPRLDAGAQPSARSTTSVTRAPPRACDPTQACPTARRQTLPALLQHDSRPHSVWAASSTHRTHAAKGSAGQVFHESSPSTPRRQIPADARDGGDLQETASHSLSDAAPP
ncbi:hypothetical protein C8R44DRAFT_980839 [Mycena epipterygia]|nr:hypothetical protein C8R44DRAFT_980839 [Mycena epipterygia]